MVLEPNFFASKSTTKCNENHLKKIKCLKENLRLIKQQTKLNNEINDRNRDLLKSFVKTNETINRSAALIRNKENNSGPEVLKKSSKYNFTKPTLTPTNMTSNVSKVNRDLIEYVKFRETYLEHINHWEQIWLFTDNPIYEYEHCEGFENPTYSYLNAKEVFELELQEKLKSINSEEVTNNIFTSESLPVITAQSSLYLNQTFKHRQKIFQNYSSVMNLYESILNESKQTNETNLATSASIPAILSEKNDQYNRFNLIDSGLISSPSSSDSGIQSDNLLSQYSNISPSITDEHICDLKKTCSKHSEDSLYSSVIMDGKKSTDNISRKISSSSKLDSVDVDSYEEKVVHLEQNELPLGWIRCCDEDGIYYWHKPSGTVTRKPPAIKENKTPEKPPPQIPKKNFNIDEYVSFQQINELINGNNPDMNTLSSSSSTSTSSNSDLKNEIENNFYEMGDENDQTLNSISSVSLAMSDSDKKNTISQSSSILSQNLLAKISQRFYVRSLGWVKIDENDLTPEKSSKAVNRCINDLSRGHRDLNDVVASWGEGKDLYMDLEDNYLILIDPNTNKALNKQSITSIRVWGVGRDNGSDRDFAYVARDKQTKIHMCHVFRCDSAPAKDIANTLRDTCRQIINDRNKQKLTLTAQIVDSNRHNNLKRPNILPDFLEKKNDFSKFKSASCHDNEFKTSIPRSQTESDCLRFVNPVDEPKKSIECKYLGCQIVSKPSGMSILNEAIEKIYSKALDNFKRTKRQNKNKSPTQFKSYDHYHDKKFSEFNEDEDEDEDNDDDDYGNFDYRDNAFSLETLDLNSDKKLGDDVEVIVSPSTVTVRKISKLEKSYKSNSEEMNLFEYRVRYLSFMGISNDVRLCGFIVHCIDNTFKCHAFLCENSSGQLMKVIEAACRLRYQKCLDAHPDAVQENNLNKPKTNIRFGNIGSQLKGMFDSIKNRSIFSSYTLSESHN